GTILKEETASEIGQCMVFRGVVVRAAEQAGLSISGSTTAEDGQQVTVTVDGHTYHGTVASGAWSVSVTDHLNDGPHTVTADVSRSEGRRVGEGGRPRGGGEPGTTVTN